MLFKLVLQKLKLQHNLSTDNSKETWWGAFGPQFAKKDGPASISIAVANNKTINLEDEVPFFDYAAKYVLLKD